MKTTLKAIAFLAITMLLTNAAVAFHGKLKISVVPGKGQIYKSNELLGTGYIEYELKQAVNVEFTFKLDGYKTQTLIFCYQDDANLFTNGRPYNRGNNSYVIVLEPMLDNGTKHSKKTEPALPPPDISKVYNATTIFFYGYDFSHMTFVEPKRFAEGEKIADLPVGITAQLAEALSTGFFKKTLEIQNIVFDYKLALAQSAKLDANTVLGATKSKLDHDSIQIWLNSYKFPQKEGIGYIVFIDCFYKPDQSTTSTFVFFDLANKQILSAHTFETKGADGHGLVTYWGIGMEENVTKYHRDVFLRKKHKFLKP